MANPEWEQFNRKVIDEFRSNGGKVGGQFAGAPMILVTHTGAKSGKTYTISRMGFAQIKYSVAWDGSMAVIHHLEGLEGVRAFGIRQQGTRLAEAPRRGKKSNRSGYRYR